TNFTSNVSAGYNVIDTGIRASGTASFHLAHPQPGANQPAVPQTLTLNRTLLVQTNSQLTFKSRLGYATTNEIARVQVSVREGGAWQSVYSQAGSGNAGETTFNNRIVSRTTFSGS